MQGGYNQPISDEVKAMVLGEYAAGRSKNAIATAHGLSWATVSKVIDRHTEDLDTLRTENRKKLLASSLEVATAYLERLGDPALIKATKAKDAAVTFGILIDKWQKESELEMTYAAMFDMAYDVVTDLLFDQLRGDPSAVREIRRVYAEKEEEIRIKAVKMMAERVGDVRKAAAEARRAEGSPAEGDNDHIRVGNTFYSRRDIVRAMGDAEPALQIQIIDAWNEAGQAEKGA